MADQVDPICERFLKKKKIVGCESKRLTGLTDNIILYFYNPPIV